MNSNPAADWTVACLGPVRLVRRGGEAGGENDVRLSAAQRKLLAVLAIAGGRVSSSDAILDALWTRGRPATARASLQNSVSRIRAMSERGVIVTVDDGYRLGVSTDLVLMRSMIDEATDLLRDGEVATALAVTERCLESWGGDAYAGMDDLDGVLAERSAANELRRRGQRLRIETLSTLGRHAEAVAAAEVCLADDPLDEHNVAMLARSLDALGRRGDALGLLDRTKRVLRAQLGVDPGAGLRGVEAQLIGSRSSESTIPRLSILGRDEVVQRVVAHVTLGTSVVLLGEPGAGKSTVLREVRRALRRRGRRSALAVAEPNSGVATAVLDELLDELGEARLLAPDAVSRFDEAVAAACDGDPIVLLVDDVSSIGPSTALALRRAVDRGSAILVASMGLADVIPPSLPDCTPVAIEPLSDEAVEELIFEARVLGVSLDAETRTSLVAQSGGNPLLLAHLLADAGMRSSGDTAEASTVRQLAVVAGRLLEPLGPDVRRVAETAAVIGESGSVPVLESLTSARAVERAVSGGILVMADPGRYRFRHGALARAIQSGIATGRRTQIQHAVAIESRRLDEPALSFAAHSLAAVGIDARRAAEDTLAAGRQSVSEGMLVDASGWFVRCREVLTAYFPMDEARILEARIAHGDALRLAGDPHHVVELLGCAEAALALGDEALIADATYALLQFGGTSQRGVPQRQAMQIARRAMKALAGSEHWALIAAATTLTLSLFDDPSGPRRDFVRALERATEERLRMKILPYAYMTFGHPRDLERRREVAAELLRIAEAERDPSALFSAHHLHYANALIVGDTDGVSAHTQAMGILAPRIGTVGARWEVLVSQAAQSITEGQLDLAERIAHDAHELLAPVMSERAAAVLMSHLFAIRRLQGRLGELAPQLADVVARQPTVGALRALHAATMVESEPDRALAEALAASGAMHEDFTWLPAQFVVGEVVAARGSTSEAKMMLQALEPWRHLHAAPLTCSFGPVEGVVRRLRNLTVGVR